MIVDDDDDYVEITFGDEESRKPPSGKDREASRIFLQYFDQMSGFFSNSPEISDIKEAMKNDAWFGEHAENIRKLCKDFNTNNRWTKLVIDAAAEWHIMEGFRIRSTAARLEKEAINERMSANPNWGRF